MSGKYTVREAYPGSHHILLNSALIAKVEEIEAGDAKRHPLLSWLPRKQKTGYVVTHLPGASNDAFMTLHAAIEHAVHHHAAGAHLKVVHPLHNIRAHLDLLRNAIWYAAADHRLADDSSQEALLDVSKHHAQLSKKFKKHFESDDTDDEEE